MSTRLGQPFDEVFRSIDAEPLASASIAQVHAATLHNGAEVVIKLVRPGIAQRINADMDNLDALADFLSQLSHRSQAAFDSHHARPSHRA